MLASTPDNVDEIRVLIVDDEPFQAELTKVNLMDADPMFKVETVLDPVKAIGLARGGSYDCVVSDFQMPGMDGVVLCSKIKAFSEIPCIIYTGRGSEEVASAAFNAGVHDYVKKEREFSHFIVLARRIRKAVESNRAERALRESEERFRALFSQAAVGIELEDLDGRYLGGNDTLSNILGYTHEEIRGMRFSDLTDKRDLKREQDLLNDLLEGKAKSYTLEKRYIRRSGEPVWARVTSSIARTSNPYRITIIEDITERKRAEERLRDSEERFRALSQSSPVGVGVSSSDGELIYTNPAYESILGYNEGELLGKKASDLYMNPEERTIWLERLNDGGSVRDFEIRLKKKDCTPIWVAINTSDIKYGGKQAVMGTIQDISKRKRAEEALRYSNEMLSASKAELAASNEMLSNLNDELASSNEELAAAEEELRTSIEELQNKNEELQAIEEELRVSSEELMHLNIELNSSNEKLRDSEASLKAYSQLLEDTVEKRTNQLMEASLYTRSLIEATLDPLVTIDADGKIMDVNEATVKATGVPREKMIGSEFADYFTEPEKTREGRKQVYSEGYIRDFPLTLRHVSGETMDVLYNATLYKDKSGKVEGIFAAARDMTERRRLEEKLLMASRMEAISKFTAMIAHDLRNPLNAIAQAAVMAEQHPERVDSMLDMIRRNAERSLGMIEELRTGTRELVAVPGRVDLKALLKQVVEDNPAPAGVCVDVMVEPGLGHVTLDYELIRRVLENLMRNAYEAMPTGGELILYASKFESGVELTVKDTGKGIPVDAQPHIFETFYTTKAKGLGLGLAFCKRAVEAHNGALMFQSKVGEGTTFTLMLPTQ